MKTAHSIEDHLEVIRKGVRPKFEDGRPKKVVIVGAGMAGLVAGYDHPRATPPNIMPPMRKRLERPKASRVFFSYKKPRRCRVLQGFEPAFAGGLRPRNAALARAYRVIPER